MKHQKISEKYQKWMIEYYSEKYMKPVYFIWLTDVSHVEEKDQILLSPSQKIIVSNSKRELLQNISESQFEFPDSERTTKWISESVECQKIYTTKYDLRTIENKILLNKLNQKDIEIIVNFINLFEDYKTQLGNEEKELKSRKKELVKVWDFYYEHIFFPKFIQSNQDEMYFEKLQIKPQYLLKEFNTILVDFEGSFKFMK